MATNQKAMEARREKAKNLRFRKPIMKDLNMESIRCQLYDMIEACGEVQWFVDSEDGNDTLLDALNGDEDEAFEFKMAFSSLSADCQRMQDDMDQSLWFPGAEDISSVDDGFNLFFAGIRAEQDGYDGMMGYDSYEEDYFGLGDYESEAAVRVAREKLQRLTKVQLIDVAQMCMRLALQFVALRSRYDDLKAAMDILRGQNAGYLQQIRAIEAAYEKAAQCDYDWQDGNKAFDKMLRELPDRTWIE